MLQLDLFHCRVDDLLGASLNTSPHQNLDFREVNLGLSVGGPSCGGPSSLTGSFVSSTGSRGAVGGRGACPSMPLTPDVDSEGGKGPSPPRSQSQPNDLTQVS